MIEDRPGLFLSTKTFFLGDAQILEAAEIVGDMKFLELFAGDRSFAALSLYFSAKSSSFTENPFFQNLKNTQIQIKSRNTNF
nr:hypothetical protein Iba_chr01cCG11000 [Ipomoea batatas]